MILLAVGGLTAFAASTARGQLPPRTHRTMADPRRAAPFLPAVQPSGLGSPVDCVIVTPDSLADIYQRLADYQTRVGIATVVRNLSTVRAADPRSNDVAQAVRSFLKAAHDLWGIRWAVLAGDHEAIPMRYARVLFSETTDIPSDAYYSDLDGTWDDGGDAGGRSQPASRTQDEHGNDRARALRRQVGQDRR